MMYFMCWACLQYGANWSMAVSEGDVVVGVQQNGQTDEISAEAAKTLKKTTVRRSLAT